MTTVHLRGSFPGTRLDVAGDGPKWNLLFPRGEWHGANLKPIGGSILIDDAMLSEMVANWENAGRPPLPVRKTHLHLDADVPAVDRPELEKSYGLLTDFRITAEGLEALTDWTSEGREVVRSGEFNFWSPEWQPAHLDRRTGDVKGWWVSGTALTNDPFFNSMPRVAASTAAQPPTHSPTTKETQMTPELKKRLKMALKCAEDCTDEDLVASCEKMASSITATTTDTTAKITAAVGAVTTQLEAKLKASDERIATLQAKLDSQAIDSLIASAKAEGRAVEPLRDFIVEAFKAGGEEKAKKLIAAAPVVPLKTEGTPGNAGDKTPEQARAALTAHAEKLSAEQKIPMSEARIRVAATHQDLATLAAKTMSSPGQFTTAKEG